MLDGLFQFIHKKFFHCIILSYIVAGLFPQCGIWIRGDLVLFLLDEVFDHQVVNELEFEEFPVLDVDCLIMVPATTGLLLVSVVVREVLLGGLIESPHVGLESEELAFSIHGQCVLVSGEF